MPTESHSHKIYLSLVFTRDVRRCNERLVKRKPVHCRLLPWTMIVLLKEPPARAQVSKVSDRNLGRPITQFGYDVARDELPYLRRINWKTCTPDLFLITKLLSLRLSYLIISDWVRWLSDPWASVSLSHNKTVPCSTIQYLKPQSPSRVISVPPENQST